MYTYDEAVTASTEYFGTELPAKVFVDKYALRDNDGNILEKTPEDMFKRIAKELARIEKKKFKEPLSYKEIYSYLDRFLKLIPQGSILYGAGNRYAYTTLSNCYVLEPPHDSYAGILYTDEQLVNIAKRRGGNGISLDNLRPTGSATKNSSGTSTGIITWMERYSNSTREVGQGGRRGALMETLNVHHPDVLEFINLKIDRSKATGANVSVQYTDEFLKALENDEEYEQRWPVESKNIPEITYQVNAKDIWDAAVEAAWDCAEPGIQFIDTVRKESPADCYSEHGYRTVTSNPCSELMLSMLDSCRLLVVNLMSCVVSPFTKDAYIDYDELYQTSKIAQRFMDDIIDLELEHIDRIIKKVEADPEPPHIKANELRTWKLIRHYCENGRRTGTGITALGDCLAATNVQYGSEESIEVVEKIYKTLKLACYESSIEMAEELGPFPVWKHELEKKNPFLNRIKDDNSKLYERMKVSGRRNIALLTTAPAGTISILAGFKVGDKIYHNTTSGIEPCFKADYTRRKKITHNDKTARVDFVDDSGDQWTEFEVYHSGKQAWLDVNGEGKCPYDDSQANDIDWVNRVKIQAAGQRHIDHSISSTINLPSDVKKDTIDTIFRTAWKEGLKGITVYRDGCRSGVLVDNKPKIKQTEAPKRPKELPCDVHHISVMGNPYFVLVGLFDGKPYEVFAGKNNCINKGVKTGSIIKKYRKQYKALFDDDSELSPLSAFATNEEEVVTRLISTALRHGGSIQFLVHQLEKTKGDLNSFSKSIIRALKKYIPDGAEVAGEECPECKSKLVREEGCRKCTACGYSVC